MGATHTLTQRVGRWWVTAVGEVPEATLLSFFRDLSGVSKLNFCGIVFCSIERNDRDSFSIGRH